MQCDFRLSIDLIMRGIFILTVVVLVLAVKTVKWQGLREDGLC